MNILTKICVVVLVVLSLFVSIVAITQANAPVNYRTLYQQEQQRRQMADQTAVNSMLAVNRLNADLADLNRTVEALKADKASSSSTDQKTISGLQVDVAKATAGVASLEAEKTRLMGLLTTAQQESKGAKSEADAIRKEVDKLREDVVSMTTANAKLELENDTIKKLVQNKDIANKDLEEQNAALQARLDDVRGGRAPADEKAPAPAAPVDLSGKVTAVRNDIASVNVGSAKDVKKGTLLTIYRGSTFVAHLRVQMVELTESSGVIINKQHEPRQGDLVKAANKQ